MNKRGNARAALVAVPLLLATASVAQAPSPPGRQTARVPDGPASAELRRMVKADQDDRAWFPKGQHPTEADLKRMIAADAKRLARARLLMKQDKIVTAEDFANAALLFQHGETPDDILIAHELAFVAQLKAPQGSISNLLVLAEDRFLDRIGRKQRFGSQGRDPAATDNTASQISEVDEEGDLAVTDALRADLFLPPLAASKQKGAAAMADHLAPIVTRLKERYNPAWQATQAQSPTARELRQLTASVGDSDAAAQAAGARALALYRADALRTPQDYFQAGALLLGAAPLDPKEDRETTARRVLLAHELATVAAVRKHPDAPRLFAQTWDRFLVMVGQPQRYGTYTVRVGGKTVYPTGLAASSNATVRKSLGVAPHPARGSTAGSRPSAARVD